MVVNVMMMVLVVMRGVVVGSLTLGIAVNVLVRMLVRTVSWLSVRHVIGTFSFSFPFPIQVALCTLTIRTFSLSHDFSHAFSVSGIRVPVHALRLLSTCRRT